MNLKNLPFRIKNKIFLNYKLSPYVSQDGQDQYIHKSFFQNSQNGFFVDIGANDGITLSNTYFFEKKLNWKGICIEPNPDTFITLQKMRNCITLNGAISTLNEKATFLKITGPSEMLSGLIDFYDAEHLKRVDRELKSKGGTKETIEVRCYRFNALLESHGIQEIDYLSIDTEGGEYNIIESIDFKKFNIKVISVENNYDDLRIKKMLHSNNFKLVNILGTDEIYVNKKLI